MIWSQIRTMSNGDLLGDVARQTFSLYCMRGKMKTLKIHAPSVIVATDCELYWFAPLVVSCNSLGMWVRSSSMYGTAIVASTAGSDKPFSLSRA